MKCILVYHRVSALMLNMFEILLLLIFVIAIMGTLNIATTLVAAGITAASYFLIKLILRGQEQIFTARLKINVSLFLYLILLIKEMITSTYKVCRMILFKKFQPNIYLLSDKSTRSLKSKSSALALYGASITLTPSTITVDINDQWVTVHSLTTDGMSGVKFLERQITKTQ